MDRFEGMSTLLAIVAQGSLSAAGRALRVPVTTVSRRLSDLETLLGTRLLLRTTRRLTLTDAGIAYVEAARRIVALVEEAEREAAGEFLAPRGELVLSAPLLFGRLHVLPVVAEFLAQFAEINVRLVLADRNVHLVDDHIDMAVRIGRLPDSTMVATRIGSMRTVICASPAWLAAHGAPQTPDDLRKLPCVSVDPAMPIAAWQVRQPDSGALREIPIVARLTVSTAAAAADAAARSVGATRLLYYQVEAAVRTGQLRIMLEEFEPEPVPIHLVHATRGQMPQKMRRFIDYAAPRLRQALNSLSV
ncbi:MAG: LysR substrate-binding domain-containing protein [Steroidobacteraceae bacterium]